MKTGIITTILFSLLLAFSGCSKEKAESASADATSFEQLSYGSDVCEFSHEVIETVRYGGRIEMTNGDKFNFMSVECLAGFYLNLEDTANVKSIKAVEFINGKRLLDVDQLVFLHSKLRPSPNGMYLTAVDASDKKMKTFIYDAYPGPYLEWDEVLELVRNEWDLTEYAASNLNF